MRRRQMMQKVSRISLCVVIGLLFLALIWKFAGAQLAKKGIVLSKDGERDGARGGGRIGKCGN